MLGAPDVPTAEAADRLERGKGKRRLLAKAVEAFQTTVIDDEEADALGLDVDLDPESVYVDAFDPSSLEVLSAFELDDTTTAVEAVVVGEVRVDVFVYRADAYGLPDDSPNHHPRLRLQRVLRGRPGLPTGRGSARNGCRHVPQHRGSDRGERPARSKTTGDA